MGVASRKKTYSLDCYGLFGTLSDDFDPDIIHDIFNSDDDKDLPLPKNQVTSAANAGMSSNWLKHCKHKGMPPNLYEMLQEMGRVNRLLLGLPGMHTFELHVSVDSHVSLFVRIMTSSIAAERRQLLQQMQEVLVRLFDPLSGCFHSSLEQYFELQVTPKTPCNQFCSNCLNEIPKQTGTFKKKKLISALATEIFTNGKTPRYKDVIKSIKGKKETIFQKGHVPDKKMGPIHALVLQLLAKGILALGVMDMTKIGTKKCRPTMLLSRFLMQLMRMEISFRHIPCSICGRA